MRRRWLIGVPVPVLVVLAVALLPGWAAEKWGPFRGQIVDVETGQPIAGAVVLVVWWELEPNPVQMSQRFYDAREAVTDAKGRFEVPRLSPPFLALRILDPNIDWFAPGYEHAKLVASPPNAEPFVAPTVIQMRRLKTREELLKKSRGYPSRIPPAKMGEFLKAIEVESQMLGLKPIGPGFGR